MNRSITLFMPSRYSCQRLGTPALLAVGLSIGMIFPLGAQSDQSFDPHAVPRILDPKTSIPKVTLKDDATAWQDGEVKLNDFVFDMIRPEVLKNSPFEDMVQRDMLKAMINAGNTNVSLAEAMEKLQTKRWVGYAYSALGDERAVPTLEDVLSKTVKPITTKAAAVDLTYLLLCLSSYYEHKAELTKAADTQLRVLDYFRVDQMPKDIPGQKVPVMGMIANNFIGAARLYHKAGNDEKALWAYSQVGTYDYGWAMGIARIDQARLLSEKGKFEEARELLQQPVSGTYADQIQVGLLTQLASIYSLSGRPKEAVRSARQAIAQYAALPAPLKDEALESMVSNATALQSWNEQWLKSPLVLFGPTQLSAVIQANQKEPPIKLTLFIRSARYVALKVTTSNAGVVARVEDKVESNEFFTQHQISLEVQPHFFSKTTDVEVKIGSLQAPQATLDVRLKVNVQSSVAISPPRLFWGKVVATKNAGAALTLSSREAFQVISVTSDDSALQVKADLKQSYLKHTIQLTFTPLHAGQFYNGLLRIRTSADEEVIEVPYAAYSVP